MQEVVVLLVPDSEGRYLSLQRSKEDGVLWSFPSGKLEKGEDEIQAILREGAEETGILCQPVRKIGDRVIGGNHLNYWECSVAKGTPRDPEPDPVTGIREVFNVAFRSPDELKKVMDPARMFEPVRKLLKINL
jgi:8-oxo-dGTP pyrophosphatase MutT (NUDIX family)